MKKIFYSIMLVVAAFIGISESLKKGGKENEEIIRSIAKIILQHQQLTGSLPDSLEQALKRTETKLRSQGDADGNALIYLKLDDRSFVLRSTGKNRTDEKGAGDDIQLIFLGPNEISRDSLKGHFMESDPEKWELLENGDFI